MFRRIFTAAALALSIGMATAPAFAADLPSPKDFFSQIVEATAPAPAKMFCPDPMDKTSCQTVRGMKYEEGMAVYTKFVDVAEACFHPKGADYAVCSNGDQLYGEIKKDGLYRAAPVDDDRCKGFGDNLSDDYLACEVALPLRS